MLFFKNMLFTYKAALIVAGGLLSYPLINMVHTPLESRELALRWGNQCLLQSFDYLREDKLKKWDVRITDDLFIRLHKEYVNGKRETYSMDLRNFSRVVHLGAPEAGALQIASDADNIIKQTFHDPHGDIDSMLMSLNLNVRNVSPAQVDTLNRVLAFLKMPALHR